MGMYLKSWEMCEDVEQIKFLNADACKWKKNLKVKNETKRLGFIL